VAFLCRLLAITLKRVVSIIPQRHLKPKVRATATFNEIDHIEILKDFLRNFSRFIPSI